MSSNNRIFSKFEKLFELGNSVRAQQLCNVFSTWLWNKNIRFKKCQVHFRKKFKYWNTENPKTERIGCSNFFPNDLIQDICFCMFLTNFYRTYHKVTWKHKHTHSPQFKAYTHTYMVLFWWSRVKLPYWWRLEQLIFRVKLFFKYHGKNNRLDRCVYRQQTQAWVSRVCIGSLMINGRSI